MIVWVLLFKVLVVLFNKIIFGCNINVWVINNCCCCFMEILLFFLFIIVCIFIGIFFILLVKFIFWAVFYVICGFINLLLLIFW